MNKENDGVVFTKTWVVELMLDTCGYVSESDLAVKIIIEPSCGQGAFLIPIVKRLLASAKNNNHSFVELINSVRAFELNKQNINCCRTKLTSLLAEAGADNREIKILLDSWLISEDYLLSNLDNLADFIVGNPPYIRSTSIDRELRKKYISKYETMTAGTDIYVGFIESGLKRLKPNGSLCYICADRWMHNAYGKKLRGLIANSFAMAMVVQMHDVDAFESEVSAYPAIIQIRKTSQEKVACATTNGSFTQESVLTLREWLSNPDHNTLEEKSFTGYWLPSWFDFDEAWPLAAPKVMEMLGKLNTHYHPLQNEYTKTRVGIGVATGSDAVFILEDPSLVEESLLLPLVTSDQTRGGKIKRKNIWLFNPWDESGKLIDVDNYPRAKKYLEEHKETLKSRHVVKKGCESNWYRTIDKVHSELTTKPKLLIQDMKSSIQPVYDSGSYYPHHNLYWITSDEWNLEVLGGLLISDMVRTVIEAYCVKMRGGTLRLQAQYLRKIRLPNPEDVTPALEKVLISAFRDNDREKANMAVQQIYNLERSAV